jgi:hypothetical protein
MRRLSERCSKATVTKSTSAWVKVVAWSLGEPVKLFYVQHIAMVEFGISVGGRCQHGVGGAPSCSMVLLWLIGEASNAEDFAPQWELLERGVYLTRSLEKAKGYIYARWGC